jgi:hypothetical protein
VSLELDLTAARVYVDERSGKIDVIERDLSVIPGPGRPAVFTKVEPPKEAQQYPDMIVSIRRVLEELLGEGEMECSAAHGRAAVEALVASYLSNKQGNAPVALPLKSKEALELWLPVT